MHVCAASFCKHFSMRILSPKKRKKVLYVFFRYKAWNWLSCTMKDLLNIGFKITTLLPDFVEENWSGILLIYAHCSPGTLKLKVGETIFNWRFWFSRTAPPTLCCSVYNLGTGDCIIDLILDVYVSLFLAGYAKLWRKTINI